MGDPVIKFRGLYTDPNQNDAPEGAALQADNVVCRRQDIVEPRRGVLAYATQAFDRLLLYAGTLIGTTSAGVIKYDNGSGTFTTISGTFASVNTTTAKHRSAEAAQDFFFTTSGGVYRMDSSSAVPLLSGAIKCPGFERDERVFTSNAGSMSLTTNVVSVATTAAHGFYVGQVITQTSATEAPYAAGNYTVLTVPSSTSFTYALVAGDDPANANPHTFRPAVLNTAAGFLTDQNQVAYRAVFNCRDTNNTLKLGAPSPRFVVANVSGVPGWITTEAKNVIVRVFVPSTVTTSHTVQLYRSKQTASTIEPDDELGLVWEALVKAGDITRGYVDIQDITPDALRGATIYTAPSQEGVAAANERPPLCNDVSAFGGSLWFDKTTGLQRIVISLLGVGSPGGVQDVDIFAFGSGTYTAKTTPTLSTHFKIETAGTASQNIRNTALNICACINRDTANTYSAFYVSGPDEAPGRILLEAKAPGAAAVYIYVSGGAAGRGKRTAWSPVLMPPSTATSSARVSNVVTVTTAFGVHNYLVGEQVTLDTPSGTFGAGPFTILSVNAAETTFTYAETGANDTLAVASYSLTTTLSTSSDANPSRSYFSKVNQPEAVPSFNYFDQGSKTAPILRGIATRSSRFVFKTDGLWRTTGSNGSFSSELFDPTVILLAPDSAVTLGNMVYALTTQGVVAISDTGSEIISKPIEKTLLSLQGLSLTNVKNITFGIGRETEGEYELRTISSASDTSATQAFIYNTRTQTWVRDTLTSKHGVVNPTDDKRYLAGATQVLKERKDFAYTDYSDVDVTPTVTSTATAYTALATTKGLWRLNEALASDEAVDAQGNYNLLRRNDPGAVAGGVIGRCRSFDGVNQDFQESLGGALATATVAGFIATHVVGGWIYQRAAVDCAILKESGVILDDTSGQNVLGELRVTSTGAIRHYHEYGAGVDVVSTQTSGTLVSLNTWTHVVYRKRVEADLTATVAIFRNGALQQTFSGLVNCDGGAANPQLVIGSAAPASGAYANAYLDDVFVEFSDLTDAEIAAIYAGGTPTSVTVSSASGISVGDVLVSGSTGRISAINGTTLTTDAGVYTAGAGTVKTGISSAVKWHPATGQAADRLKLWRSVTFLLGNAHAATATASFATELVTTAGTASVDLATEAGQWVLASSPWDGTERAYNLRLDVPQEQRRAARLTVAWAMQNAWAHYNISGLAYAFSPGSERVSS